MRAVAQSDNSVGAEDVQAVCICIVYLCVPVCVLYRAEAQSRPRLESAWFQKFDCAKGITMLSMLYNAFKLNLVFLSLRPPYTWAQTEMKLDMHLTETIVDTALKVGRATIPVALTGHDKG